MFFVDNESARLAQVKAYSSIAPSLDIVMDCLKWDVEHDVQSWYARVPTLSNIGDDPSRMKYTKQMKQLGLQVVVPVFPAGTSAASVLNMEKFSELP